MIVLNVKEYCHSCIYFEPEAIDQGTKYYSDHHQVKVGDTMVQCIHKEICDGICDHLEQMTEEPNDRRRA